MDTQSGVARHNWFGDIRWTPAVVARPSSEQELIAIVKDHGRFPSPLRAAGSGHSTTRCVIADGGTIVDMRGMNRIIRIDGQTVSAQAFYICCQGAAEAWVAVLRQHRAGEPHDGQRRVHPLWMEETSPEEAVQMMASPYFGAFNITRAILPAKLRRQPDSST